MLLIIPQEDREVIPCPFLKVPIAALDPLGLPLVTTVVAGNTADDPLYVPVIARVQQS